MWRLLYISFAGRHCSAIKRICKMNLSSWVAASWIPNSRLLHQQSAPSVLCKLLLRPKSKSTAIVPLDWCNLKNSYHHSCQWNFWYSVLCRSLIIQGYVVSYSLVSLWPTSMGDNNFEITMKWWRSVKLILIFATNVHSSRGKQYWR